MGKESHTAQGTETHAEAVAGNQVPERIVKFIRRHHVMTAATVSGEGPWCANLFYSYIAEQNIFVFTTEEKTRHGAEMAADGFVAASVVLETRHVGWVRGLQLQGDVSRPDGELLTIARRAYLKRFPYAAAAELHLWVLRPTLFKLTDNRLGFGKKLYWHA